MKKIAVLGCVSVDSIIYMKEFPEVKPQTLIADRFYETVGSTGSGKALNLAKLGFDVVFQAMLGDDYYGRKIIDFLSKQENLQFYPVFDLKPTQRHFNIMNQHGERISIFVEESSSKLTSGMTEAETLIKNSDFVILNIAAYCKDYIQIIKKHKKEIWCDIHDYDGKNEYHKEFIDCADYIFMSSDNCPDYKTVMEKFIKDGKKIVVCTHGKKGSTLLKQCGEYIDLPIVEKYKMIDTNGAGDSFMSGFIYGYYNGYSLYDSMKLATVNGGLCINSKELVCENLSSELLFNEYKKYYCQFQLY